MNAVVGGGGLAVACLRSDDSQIKVGALVSVISVGLSPSYGLLTAREAHDWFLNMKAENEEFEVETDRAGE